MQRDDSRDQAIDRALRQSIGRSTSAADDHVDGETLAAWSDGQLRSDAAARVERHVADCARCQHLLATFARTTPPPIASEHGWRGRRFRWLIPFAAAATAVGIWMTLPRQNELRVEQPIADSAAAAADEPQRQSAPLVAATRGPAPSSTSQPAPPARLRASAPGAVASAAPTPAISSLEKRDEFERRDAQGKAVTQLEQPAGAASVADTRAKEADKPAALAETIQIAPQTPAAARPQPASAAARAAGLESARAPVLRQAAPVEIVSPVLSNRWRIIGGQRIERSTTGGQQWDPAGLLSPPPGDLTAGMSPAPTVCWIVGRAGSVYVTSDGVSFVRVAFPESIDVTSVTATDDRIATVMSADGRWFRTEDQGNTWTPTQP